MKTHLVRNVATGIWCEAQLTPGLEYDAYVGGVTCEPCLRAAAKYGADAQRQLVKLLSRTEVKP